MSQTYFISFYLGATFQNKINLIHWRIWLVLLQKYITMHGPMNVKFLTISGNKRCSISNTSNLSFYAGTAGHKDFWDATSFLPSRLTGAV